MMETAPPSEKLRRWFVGLSESASPAEDCPAPEVIWEALRGAAPPHDIDAVVAHTSRCFVCAEAWRLGFGLSRGMPRVATFPARTRAPRVWVGLAAAASVLIVAGIGIALLPRAPQPIVMRAGDAPTISSLIPETKPLPRAACRLKWSEPSAEARYTIRIGTEDLSPIASQRNLGQPEYIVPAKSLEKLAPGATIVWRVEAALPDGRHVASPSFKNTVE